MADTIDYQSGATVILFGSDTPNWTGTLAGAIRRVMAMEPHEQSRASIAVDHDVVPDTTLLDYEKIEELYRRPDFPRQ